MVTADLRLNEPRYASLPNIMKAKKKAAGAADARGLWACRAAPRLTVLRVEEPVARASGIKVGSVAELLDKLKTEAAVI